MVAPGYDYGTVPMATLGYGGPQSLKYATRANGNTVRYRHNAVCTWRHLHTSTTIITAKTAAANNN